MGTVSIRAKEQVYKPDQRAECALAWSGLDTFLLHLNCFSFACLQAALCIKKSYIQMYVNIYIIVSI